MPIISHTTHDRHEGYFRLEWKLAIDRSDLIDTNWAFLLPIVIDDTRDDDARVPERFREVQWTRLPGGETPPAFVDRVRHLLAGEASTQMRANVQERHQAPSSSPPKRGVPVAVAAAITAALLLAFGYFGLDRLRGSNRVFRVSLLPYCRSRMRAAMQANSTSRMESLRI